MRTICLLILATLVGCDEPVGVDRASSCPCPARSPTLRPPPPPRRRPGGRCASHPTPPRR
ncbi:MAG: hypothetical protein R3F43_17085 [bacterium]